MFTRSGIRAPAVLLTWGLLAGCTDTSVPVGGVYHPTLIEVSPSEFLGDIPCVDAPGAMRTYVATVYDVEFDSAGAPIDYSVPEAGDEGAEDEGETPEEPSGVDTCPGLAARGDGFPLPSSGPVSCKNAVAFARVVEPHRYRAEIRGYEGFAPEELGPLAPGVPSLVRLDTGERVEPRWTIRCGDVCPASARSFLSRRVEGCELVDDAGGEPTGPSSVSVSLDEEDLGELGCGTGTGEIDHFEVRDGGEVVGSVPCGETLTITEADSRGTIALDVLAYEADNTLARWATTCTATLIQGLDVPATCGRLSDRGAVKLEPEVALAALGTDCAGLAAVPAELELTLRDAEGNAVGAPRFIDAGSCAKTTHFTGVTSGPALVGGRLIAAGSELGRVACGATVVPGTATAATCVEDP
jgi:hypothetical protein